MHGNKAFILFCGFFGLCVEIKNIRPAIALVFLIQIPLHYAFCSSHSSRRIFIYHRTTNVPQGCLPRLWKIHVGRYCTKCRQVSCFVLSLLCSHHLLLVADILPSQDAACISHRHSLASLWSKYVPVMTMWTVSTHSHSLTGTAAARQNRLRRMLTSGHATRIRIHLQPVKNHPRPWSTSCRRSQVQWQQTQPFEVHSRSKH
jgi:hypothetical protein